MTQRKKPADVIADWQAAFEIANGKLAPTVDYKAGWYKMAHGNYRREQMEAMTENLRKRASE